jgi:predicted nucleotidyltransferase
MKYSLDKVYANHPNLPWLKNNVIFLTKHGSHAYGLNTLESDLDVKGILIPPLEYHIGFINSIEQIENKDPDDLVIFALKKFFQLAANCNPSVLEILFTDQEDRLFVHPVAQKLIDNKDLFLSKKCRFTFEGYAHSQLKRMILHRRYLTNPLTKKPERSDFNLPERTIIPKDQLEAAQSSIRKKLETWNLEDLSGIEPANRIAIQNSIEEYLSELQITSEKKYILAAQSLGFDDNFIRLLDLERQYKARIIEWHQYQTWLKERNPKRSEIEKKFGYDCKNAMHLIRLTKCCKELLTTGELNVKRHDRDELLAIRNGAWTYDQVIEWADREKKEIDILFEKSTLPQIPPMNKLDDLHQEVVSEFLGISK